MAVSVLAAASSGDTTQNVLGAFFSKSVSTKPGLIVVTTIPYRDNRLRSASRYVSNPAFIIGRTADTSAIAGNRADADNMARSRALKAQGGLIKPGDRSQEVGGHHRFIFLEIILMKSDGGLHGRAIDNQIQATEIASDLVKQHGHLLVLRDVMDIGQDEILADAIAQSSQIGFAPGDGRHVIALAR